MWSLSGKYNRKTGPIADVLFFPAISNRDAKPHKFKALFDTGASRTAISREVIRTCHPRHVGESRITNINKTEMHDNYAFDIGFRMKAQNGSSKVIVMPTVGSEYLTSNNSFDILLGRDVICRGIFCISKDGTFEFIL